MLIFPFSLVPSVRPSGGEMDGESPASRSSRSCVTSPMMLTALSAMLGGLHPFAGDDQRFDGHRGGPCLEIRTGPLHRERTHEAPALDRGPALVVQNDREAVRNVLVRVRRPAMRIVRRVEGARHHV